MIKSYKIAVLLTLASKMKLHQCLVPFTLIGNNSQHLFDICSWNVADVIIIDYLICQFVIQNVAIPIFGPQCLSDFHRASNVQIVSSISQQVLIIICKICLFSILLIFSRFFTYLLLNTHHLNSL